MSLGGSRRSVVVVLVVSTVVLMGCSADRGQAGSPSSGSNVLDVVESSTTVDAGDRAKCEEATLAPGPASDLTGTLKTTFGETRAAMEDRYGEEVVANFAMPFDPADAVTLCSYSTAGTFEVIALLDSGESFSATVGS